jgi:hypothetical protein
MPRLMPSAIACARTNGRRLHDGPANAPVIVANLPFGALMGRAIAAGRDFDIAPKTRPGKRHRTSASLPGDFTAESKGEVHHEVTPRVNDLHKVLVNTPGMV